VFSGLINHTGILRRRASNRIEIGIPASLHDSLRLGDSVAVNGVCLTAASIDADAFAADLLSATLADTTLGSLDMGSLVNLEPALRVGDPLGGHIVQGHVDGTAELKDKREMPGGDWLYSFKLPVWLDSWIVPKGSICIDGVSLTVQELAGDSFSVQLIPMTLELTNLGLLEAGQRVNLEADLIVKTVARLMQRGLWKEGLAQSG
jgi:riboflavin synthase